ncbi:hypothetical protein [Paraburkholderia humisilvae]|nr:hypothetical protein [Paraburkholderia humisilvae]
MLQLEKRGKQTISIESLLGVSDLFLAYSNDKKTVNHEEISNILTEKLNGLNREEPVYIEWTPLDFMGATLPIELIDNIRRFRCLVLSCPRQKRLTRLLKKYAEWESNIESVIDKVSGRLSPENLHEMLLCANSSRKNRFPEFVTCMVDRYLDPACLHEIFEFDCAFVIKINASGRDFLSTFIPNQTREGLIQQIL